jgi:hypothetical protein
MESIVALSNNIMQLISEEINKENEFQNENRILIEKIIQMACQDNLRLDVKYPPARKILLAELPKYRNIPSEELDNCAQTIFQKIQKAYYPSPNVYASRGRFNTEYIHRRGERDWLEDHDMSYLMPRSTPHIAVLAPLDTGIGVSRAFTEGLSSQLSNPEIKHIMFPIGPIHWRGGYLSKPTESNPKYTLEIFDSFGENSAKSVLKDVKSNLKSCNIEESALNVKFSSPPVLQRDGYSCGDFTCAYSHQKMLDFDAPNSAVNLELANALNQGNAQQQLRKTICKQFDPGPLVLHTPQQHIIEDILKMKDTLFHNAERIKEKQKNSTTLTDEEYATLLQVEEIKKLSPK